MSKASRMYFGELSASALAYPAEPTLQELLNGHNDAIETSGDHHLLYLLFSPNLQPWGLFSLTRMAQYQSTGSRCHDGS